MIFSIMSSLGSFPTASKEPLSVWRTTAEAAFEYTKDTDFVVRNGLYDKHIIGYSFKQDLKMNKFSELDDFQPILTTNGICYTFNGRTFPSIWRDSMLTKTFIDIFPDEAVKKYFGGAGNVQGNKSNEKCSLC